MEPALVFSIGEVRVIFFFLFILVFLVIVRLLFFLRGGVIVVVGEVLVLPPPIDGRGAQPLLIIFIILHRGALVGVP